MPENNGSMKIVLEPEDNVRITVTDGWQSAEIVVALDTLKQLLINIGLTVQP
jgi:hypothetical protein